LQGLLTGTGRFMPHPHATFECRGACPTSDAEVPPSAPRIPLLRPITMR